MQEEQVELDQEALAASVNCDEETGNVLSPGLRSAFSRPEYPNCWKMKERWELPPTATSVSYGVQDCEVQSRAPLVHPSLVLCKGGKLLCEARIHMTNRTSSKEKSKSGR